MDELDVCHILSVALSTSCTDCRLERDIRETAFRPILPDTAMCRARNLRRLPGSRVWRPQLALQNLRSFRSPIPNLLLSCNGFPSRLRGGPPPLSGHCAFII